MREEQDFFFWGGDTLPNPPVTPKFAVLLCTDSSIAFAPDNKTALVSLLDYNGGYNKYTVAIPIVRS